MYNLDILLCLYNVLAMVKSFIAQNCSIFSPLLFISPTPNLPVTVGQFAFAVFPIFAFKSSSILYTIRDIIKLYHIPDTILYFQLLGRVFISF